MKLHYILYLSLITLVTYCTQTSGRNETAINNDSKKENTTTQSLQEAVNLFVKDKDLKHANLGFYAIDTQTGQLLAAHNSDKCIIPASTQKVITTATAIDILGADYQFTTTLEYSGTIDAATKTLKGNIYIKGGGDPTLGSPRFAGQSFLQSWVDAIKKTGINTINGHIIGDASCYSYEMTPRNWSWEDISNYYASGASGLSVYENSYKIYFKSGSSDGAATTITKTEPNIPNLQFQNEVKASNINSDNAFIFGAPYATHRIIRGTIPKGRSNFVIKGALPEPALIVALELKDLLEKNKVAVKNTATTLRKLSLENKPTSENRIRITTTKSAMLSEIVRLTNTHSINMFAEHLINHIGWIQSKDGSTKGGVEALATHWKALGLDTDGLRMKDGSGLSYYNTLTPEQIVYILNYMTTTSKNKDYFMKSLPVSGTSGTLKHLCENTLAQGKITAKSGTIEGVRAYAGYATTADNKQITFAILANNYSCKSSDVKKKMEKVMLAMASMKLSK